MVGPATGLEPAQFLRARRGPLASLRDEMEGLLSGLCETGDSWFSGRIIPSLDLSETDDAVEVKMDVPGVKPADIDIQINGNLLTISGQRQEEKQEKGRTFHRVERRSGGFSRTVTLPCTVDEAKVDAQYRDGILRVNMPKTAESKAHKIKVKAAE